MIPKVSAKCLAFLSAAAITIVPTLALAQTVEPTALEKFTTEVMNVLVPVFVMFIGGLATWILNLFRKKTGIQIGDAQIAAWSGLARKSALRGAEWARKKAKESTDGRRIPGPEVLEVAANFAVEMGIQANLPTMGRAKLEALIEAELFELRREQDRSETEPEAGV